ncbi:hypothetical protein ciss_15350 [Carboxydothermus islandicus]|uniref:Uncharacterized protein n=2 Tax=Carboxydothermus islandicus TaxID=661089 RepID=A0A1L8D348_9THEO|nr:hypothetical protein ciss_15350 [Carboxydothermus islandicus]
MMNSFIKNILIFLVYFLPVSCALFVINMVIILKKIHNNNMNTGLNTFLATVGLLFIAIAVATIAHY